MHLASAGKGILHVIGGGGGSGPFGSQLRGVCVCARTW